MAKLKINTKAILAGGISGAAASYASTLLGPTLGPAVALGGVGAYMGNETLQTLAGMNLGRQLLSGAPGAQTGGGFV